MDEEVSGSSRQQHRPWEPSKYNNSGSSQPSPTVSLAEILDTAFSSEVDSARDADFVLGISNFLSSVRFEKVCWHRAACSLIASPQVNFDLSRSCFICWFVQAACAISTKTCTWNERRTSIFWVNLGKIPSVFTHFGYGLYSYSLPIARRPQQALGFLEYQELQQFLESEFSFFSTQVLPHASLVFTFQHYRYWPRFPVLD